MEIILLVIISLLIMVVGSLICLVIYQKSQIVYTRNRAVLDSVECITEVYDTFHTLKERKAVIKVTTILLKQLEEGL